MRAFVLAEILLALLIVMVALHLFLDFLKSYDTHLSVMASLDSISAAQIDLLEKPHSKEASFQTTNLKCNAVLNYISGNVVYHQFRIKECQ